MPMKRMIEEIAQAIGREKADVVIHDGENMDVYITMNTQKAVARLIGKGGSTAKLIRDIVSRAYHADEMVRAPKLINITIRNGGENE
jgi:predicted RNA-binding protein YlqC (UPF0109 family)